MTDNQNTQTTPTDSSVPKTDAKELGLFAAGGALAGAGVSHLVGGMGLAVAGTAVGIGMLPVAIAGTVAGAAAYGVKKALFDSSATAADPNQPSTAADPNPPSTVATVTNTVSNVATQTVDTVSEWAGKTASWISKKVKGTTVSSDDDATKKT